MQTPSYPHPNHISEEDEIDLRELFKTILRYKKFIIVFSLITTIVATIWVLLKNPVYEVKSNLQIGYIGGGLIEKPLTIVKTAKLVFHVDDEVTKNKKLASKVTDISLNKKIDNFIEIKAEAYSNEEALKKNKEVVSFIQNQYENKIKEYIKNNKNKIENLKQKEYNLDNKTTQDTKKEIKKLKEQTIAQIDEKIKKLKEQDIANINQEIKRLKEQTIAQIDEKINFLKNTKIKTLNNKIKIYNNKLHEYQNSIKKLYKKNINNKDATTSTIASLQMVNYQNLILNAQNKLEDLKLEIVLIKNETIPNLQIEKENIQNDKIKNLQMKIKNITNITIKNLQMKKENIQNDKIRDLEYKLNVTIPKEKLDIQNQIKKISYLNSKDNIQNSKVVGGYIVGDYPVKPKKKLIIVVAFITSLILSIFLIFFIEFLKEEK